MCFWKKNIDSYFGSEKIWKLTENEAKLILYRNFCSFFSKSFRLNLVHPVHGWSWSNLPHEKKFHPAIEIFPRKIITRKLLSNEKSILFMRLLFHHYHEHNYWYSPRTSYILKDRYLIFLRIIITAWISFYSWHFSP